MSFVYGISASRIECYLLKRSHDEYFGQHTFFHLPFICDSCKIQHRQKYVFLFSFLFNKNS